LPLPELRRGVFASLRIHYNYRLYFSGQIISYTGSAVSETALYWLVLERTHSPVLLGLLVLCHYGPFAVLGLWGGIAADRFDNRQVLLGTQGAGMAIALLLIAAYGLAGPLWVVFALAVGSGMLLALDNPSKYALIYQLVSRAEVANAISLNSTLQNVAKIAGPALGGLIIASVGVGWCFLVNAASFIAVLAGLVAMRRGELFPLERPDTRPSSGKALREGFAYIRTSRELLTLVAMALAFGALGFSALKALLSVLATETLRSGAETFGALGAAYGVGAVLGGLVSAAFSGTSWRRLTIGAAGFSGGILTLAVIDSVVLACVLLVLVGMSWTTYTSGAQSIALLTAPDSLRGRVMSIYIGALLLGVLAGGPLNGWLAAVGGTPLAFSVVGAAGLVATGLAASWLRSGPRQPVPPDVTIVNY
jgi:MFS family permease